MVLNLIAENLPCLERPMDFNIRQVAHIFPKAMVQTIKKMLKRSEDKYMAILSYGATPMPWCGLSPSELSMGRRLRTKVPQTSLQLTPQWSYLAEFASTDKKFKGKQKKNFNRRHKVCEHAEIPDGSEVWVTTDNHPTNG